MDDFVSGALFSHIVNSSNSPSPAGQVTPQQYAKVYAALIQATNDYNALVDQYNQLVKNSQENDAALRQHIEAQRQTIEQQQRIIHDLQQQNTTRSALLNDANMNVIAQDRIIKMMAEESKKTDGHDDRPLSAREDLRHDMMNSLRARMSSRPKPPGAG